MSICRSAIKTMVVVGLWAVTHAMAAETPISAKATVYFAPNEGAEEAILYALGNAKLAIHVQAYSFTSQKIAQAIVSAKKRGVAVAVILDKSQVTQRHSMAGFLAEQGVPVFIDHSHAIAHNKVMLIDRNLVITGSYNFTKSAEQANAENLLVMNSADLKEKYQSNWERHFAHSYTYQYKSQSF